DGDGGGKAAVLSGTQSFVLTVVNPNRPPHLAPIGDKVAVVGQQLQFPLRVSDLDQDDLSYSALGLPATATLTPTSTYGLAMVSWTPTAADVGVYSVVFHVDDSGNGNSSNVLSDQRGIRLVVRNSNQAPSLVPPGNQTFAQGTTLVVALQA